MEIKVLFFGATADATGKRADLIIVEDGCSIGLATARLSDKYPSLKSHKLIFAVNEEYANPSDMLSDGDELAVFTAVSGG